MAVIYRTNQRIKFKIDDVVITVSPMTTHQKAVVQNLMAKGITKSDLQMVTEGVTSAIKFALKDISGVVYEDGSEFKLQFDEEGYVTQECINELMNMDCHEKMTLVCSRLVKGIPKEIVDERGKPVEGIEFISSKASEEPKSPNS